MISCGFIADSSAYAFLYTELAGTGWNRAGTEIGGRMTTVQQIREALDPTLSRSIVVTGLHVYVETKEVAL